MAGRANVGWASPVQVVADRLRVCTGVLVLGVIAPVLPAVWNRKWEFHVLDVVD